MKREIRQGDEIPNGYGIGYFCDYKRIAVCYPIPLNIVVSKYLQLNTWLKYGYGPHLNDLDEMYALGFRAGSKAYLKHYGNKKND